MKTFAPISSEQSASDAFAVILAHNFENLISWQEKARGWDDIEGVHQVRVSFRRLRSAFSVFRPILAREDRLFWSERIRDLVEPTGMARDIDVLIDEGLTAFHQARPGIEPAARARFDELLEFKREEAYDAVRTMLDGEDYAEFKTDCAAWIAHAGWNGGTLKPKKRRRLQGNVMPLAGRILAKQDDTVQELGADTEPDDAAAMHQLRIACKKLRYASEFFAPLYADMDGFIMRLKGIQDILGVMHDAAVLPALLEAVVPADADPALNAYVRDLIAWREAQYTAKAKTFATQWHAFLAAARPWLS